MTPDQIILLVLGILLFAFVVMMLAYCIQDWRDIRAYEKRHKTYAENNPFDINVELYRSHVMGSNLPSHNTTYKIGDY